MITTEKRFESDIEATFLSSAGGYARVLTKRTYTQVQKKMKQY